jgi:opacity protein-like surface antigen
MRCVLGLALMMAVASPAAAQAGKPAAANTGLMVRGLGGVTFTGTTGGIFSGAVGVGVGKSVVIFGEVGRMTNVVPGSIQDLIDQLVQGSPGDASIELKLRVPSTFYLGGVRFVIKTKGRIQPFVEGGAGLAHLTVSASLKVDGQDFTQELEDFLKQEAGVPLSANQLLIMAGGGVTCRLNPHTSVDAGYRLMFIATEDPSVKTNAVYAALTWRR